MILMMTLTMIVASIGEEQGIEFYPIRVQRPPQNMTRCIMKAGTTTARDLSFNVRSKIESIKTKL